VNYALRQSRMKTAVGDSGLDALVVSHPANVAYLTGFTGSNGQVVIHASDSTPDMLLTDRRYEGRTGDAGTLQVVFDTLTTVLENEHGTVGIEAQHVSWATVQRLKKDMAEVVTLRATSGMVEDFRQYKDADELAQLKAACDITVAALGHVFDTRLEGETEQAIAWRVQHTMRELGADGDAFAPIVATGVNGAIAHHSPSTLTVQRGTLLTIDCGARVNGYHADYTRTVAVGAAPPSKLANIHHLVRDAQHAATAQMVAGALVGDVDQAARHIIEQAGYGAFFVHGTGHGVGLEIHEAPLIGPKATARLAPAVTCTSEPGIYLPGVGGVRIEDTVVVTASGAPQILTEAPRDLVIV